MAELAPIYLQRASGINLSKENGPDEEYHLLLNDEEAKLLRAELM